MKVVYGVKCYYKKFNEESLSRECYDSLEKAQTFCTNRYKSKKIDELTYEGDGCTYKIIALNVK
jgi:hypothetical protein